MCFRERLLERGVQVTTYDFGFMDNSITNYSWLATLRLQNNPKQLVCGGSLIGPKTVLTAAHCYKPFFKSVADGYVCHYKREMINSIFFK
jgi:secreted trypsin-like serine protease